MQLQLAACFLLVLFWCYTALPAAAKQDTHNPLEKIQVASTRLSLDNNIALSLNSTVLDGSHSYFELSWTGVTSPSYGDWVGLILAGTDFTKTSPAKYQVAAIDRNHLLKGEGKINFRLINYRSPMQFAFFRGGMMRPVLAALSPVIAPQNPNEPLQRHLALTGDNTQMLVQWVTQSSKHPVVKWGTSPGRYTTTTPARSTTTYTREELCGPPATTIGYVDPGLFHAALLEGLVPGQRYYYAVGDEEWGFSPEASFKAAPRIGPATRVKVLAVADLGQGELDGSMEQSEMLPSINTTQRMLVDIQELGYELLVHNGDISYARGYVTQWDNFMHQIEPLVSQVPYMTVPGNHERDWPNSGDRFTNAYDSGGECGIPLERRVVMPVPGPDKPWYSFDYGPIHFLQYSTEHDFHPGSEQHNWVLADLAAVDRALTPWVVVGGHRPFYISSTNTMPEEGDQPVAEALREAFEDAFVQYKVDLTLHGHHHSYQRTCPVIGNKCWDAEVRERATRSGSFGGARSSQRRRGSSRVIDAANSPPVHLVIGNGGAELCMNVDMRPPDIWESIKLWWGYLRLDATGTELKCEAVSDLDGKIMDSFTLTKPAGWGKEYMHQEPAAKQQQQQKLLCGQGHQPPCDRPSARVVAE